MRDLNKIMFMIEDIKSKPTFYNIQRSLKSSEGALINESIYESVQKRMDDIGSELTRVSLEFISYYMRRILLQAIKVILVV